MREYLLELVASQHSAWGASGAHRWMKCPGSIQAQKDLKQKPSKYAMEGTAAHGLAELCLKSSKKDAGEYLGEVIHVVEDGVDMEFEVTTEMINAVNVYIEYCLFLEEKQDWFGYESKIALARYSPQGIDAYGRVDFACLIKDNLYVVDYKHGAGKAVYAEDNAQMKFYALGLVERLADSGFSISKVKLVIVQPRCKAKNNPIDESEWMTLQSLSDWGYQELHPAMKATLLDDAPRRGGHWCKWCLADAPGHCDVRGNKVKADKLVEKGVMDGTLGELLNTDPKNLSDFQTNELLTGIARAREGIKAFEKLAKLHEDAAKEKLEEHSTALVDWELKPGNKKKTWGCGMDVLKEKLSEALDVDELFEVKSVAKVTKLLDKGGHVSEELLEGLVTYTRGKPSLRKRKEPLSDYNEFETLGI